MKRSLPAISVLLLSLMALCRCESKPTLTASDTSLLQTVAELRNSPPEKKAIWLRRLERAECVGAQVCQLKQICLTGYSRYERALGSTRVARKALEGSQAGDPKRAAQSGKLLLSAEELLQRAHSEMTECASLESRLRLAR